MSELERINKYIERTKISSAVKDHYGISCDEIGLFYGELGTDPFNAIFTIFNYGRAKGFRAARRRTTK